jgi:hypothetical protein
MFDFFMESIIVSFSVGAVVGAVVTSHFWRPDRPRRADRRLEDGDVSLVKIRVKKD